MTELRWPGASQPHATAAGWDHRDSDLQQRWRGPSSRSNWLVPGRVLCGDQPYTLDKAEGRAGVAACGVATIVCLRTKSEMASGKNSYVSSMTKLLGKQVAKFVSFPIVDQNVADDDLVSEFIEQLLGRIAGGEVLYIHCHGGHGRTGTICSLLLGRLYGLSGEDALTWYKRLHNMRSSPVFTAPLFPPQMNQVKRLLDGSTDPEVNGRDVIEEGVAACRAACKAGDAAQCNTAAEFLLGVAPNHPLGLAAQAVGLMKQGVWNQALKRCEFALMDGAVPPKLAERLQGMASHCKQQMHAQMQPLPAPVAASAMAFAGEAKYPSTQHLPFSPGLGDGDTQLTDAACGPFFDGSPPLVLTEKLDGGNCCIKNGLVYARTHKHPAKHPWFDPLKAMHHVLSHTVAHPNLELFGENMTATHSICYGNLTSYFYLFGARKRGVWCSWEEVEKIAAALGIPTVPVLFKGTLQSTAQLRALIEKLAQGRSGVGAVVKPEGFVLRLARRFSADEFGTAMAKYVRPNHVQTGDDFSKLYPRNKAKLCSEALPQMTAWQTSVELDPEPEPELEPEPTLAPSPARAVAAKRLSGKAKKAAAAAEKTRRNRRKQAPKLLVLAGLPGCGKSTFAKLLEASDPQWVHADSDVLRRDMESVVGRAAAGRNPKRVIVDKCNVEPRDRRPWPGLAHRPPVNDCMLVVFDVDVEECCKRVVARVGHPTIQAGHHNAAAIVRSFAKRWAPPESASDALAEGYGRFVRVESVEQVSQLLISFGVDPAAATPAATVAAAAESAQEERLRREAAEVAHRAAELEEQATQAELATVEAELATMRPYRHPQPRNRKR